MLPSRVEPSCGKSSRSRDLVWDGDRVVGDQRPQPERRQRRGAGTDRHRRRRRAFGVAKAVRAPEYDVKPPLATFYYSYYSGFEADDIEQYVRDFYGAACFPTHDGLTLMAAVWPSARFNEVRADIEGHVQEGARVNPKRRRQAAAREA